MKNIYAQPISQRKIGQFAVIRIAPKTGTKGEITDKICRLNWHEAAQMFADCIKREDQGCKWEIICPDGQIGACAEF